MNEYSEKPLPNGAIEIYRRGTLVCTVGGRKLTQEEIDHAETLLPKVRELQDRRRRQAHADL